LASLASLLSVALNVEEAADDLRVFSHHNLETAAHQGVAACPYCPRRLRKVVGLGEAAITELKLIAIARNAHKCTNIDQEKQISVAC
jgi:hypothetical protein